MTEPRWLDAREARLWQSYRDSYRELVRALEARMLANSGLSGADYALLHPLSTSECGVLRTRDLGKSVGWERSRLSHQVSRMEKRGLVVREECESDARGSMVRLTDLGRKAIEAAAPDHVEAVRTYFLDTLTREEQDVLTTVLDRVLSTLPTRDPCAPTDCVDRPPQSVARRAAVPQPDERQTAEPTAASAAAAEQADRVASAPGQSSYPAVTRVRPVVTPGDPAVSLGRPSVTPARPAVTRVRQP
jgi:DNA-binding MarR family transcriptional regulator